MALFLQSILFITIVTSQSFLLGPTALNWTDSVLYCETLGSHLASIHSQSDFIEIKSLCNDTTTDCWIGLNDIDSEAIWQWNDGTITDYGFINNSNTNPAKSISPWASNEPSGTSNNKQDCIELDKNRNFAWDSVNCNQKHYPICNYPPSICISGSIYESTINGKYKYHSWDSNNNGAIYYNEEWNRYLYPWISSNTEMIYIIGFDISTNLAASICHVPSDSMYLTPYDCYNNNGGQLYADPDGQWIDDDNARLQKCPGVFGICFFVYSIGLIFFSL